MIAASCGVKTKPADHMITPLDGAGPVTPEEMTDDMLEQFDRTMTSWAAASQEMNG